MMFRIVVASANNETKNFIKFWLKESFALFITPDTASCLKLVAKLTPHLVIISEEGSGITAQDICERIRLEKRFAYMRILVLTNFEEENYFSSILNAGADDIINLPVPGPVFINRVKAMLRRSKPHKKDRLSYKDLVISPETYTIIKNAKEFSLPKKEFELLYLLASAPGKVFSRIEILETIWEEGVLVGDRTIDVHVRKIRMKLDADYIRTIKSIGYKFVAEQ